MTEWMPGDVALCVDARDPAPEYGDWPPLRSGARYTVTAVGVRRVPAITCTGHGTGHTTLRLLELRNSANWFDGAFDARRFVKQPPLLTETEETARCDLDEEIAR